MTTSAGTEQPNEENVLSGLDAVPVHVVAARLGHADPAITLRVYAHVLPVQASEVASLFAAAMADSGTPEATELADALAHRVVAQSDGTVAGL